MIYIALLRGINVGGHNILPMKDLRELLLDLDLQQVRTYIQSGNVIFQSTETDTSKLGESIRTSIGERFGFEPKVLILTKEELEEAMASNPYPNAEKEPKSLHLFFLTSAPPNPDLAALKGTKKDSEDFSLIDRVFYLHAPEGIGRSRLAAGIEKALGVPITGRNWRTLGKILTMAGESE